MNICLITTFNRQKEVHRLVHEASKIFDGQIVLFDDGSNPPAFPHSFGRFKVFYYEKNHGKRMYWKLITDAFQYLKTQDFKYFWMIPDDVILQENFFTYSLDLWERINDIQKICLSTGHCHGRHYNPNWTYFNPIKMGEVVLTGWNDLCFMAERHFLAELNFNIEQPLDGYDYRSSGVGRYISRRLFDKGYNLYHIDNSLCEFPSIESVMHGK